MEPTLSDGERLITQRISYYFGAPQRYDIIWFKAPADDAYYIKRVIALPGEHIKISGGSVFVNGRQLSEEYLGEVYTEGELELIVGENELFVMGDNRAHSLDSRSFGCISTDSVGGKVILRFYPWEFFGTAKAADRTAYISG